MKTKSNIIISVLFCFTILIGLTFMAGCGGGGGGGSDGTSGGGTTAATSVSEGPIEGFGSVFVNGVEWETDSAEFEIEDSSGSESDLQIGMLVKVEGRLDDNGTTGTATSISFDDNLEGPISTITPSSTGNVKTLQVMGQEVIVEDGLTFFDNNDPTFNFATMAVGDVVEVSGPTNFDGSIQATFIEKKADDQTAFLAGDNELEVKGVVSGLTATTFLINGLTVDFSGVTPRNGTLANGVFVEVKSTNPIVGNTLTATDVEIKPAGLGVDDIDEAEVEGFVANLDTAAQTFTVNGQLVDYSAAVFIGGPETDLLNGTKVEAEGSIVSGVLQAEKIKFEESIEFEANVATVGASTLTLEDLPGITVMVDNALTEIEPAGSGLSNDMIGNEVKIRAREGSAGDIVAIELEILDEASDRAIIQGPVDSFAAETTVTILGVVVNTTTIDDDDFEDINDLPIGRTAFFNQLAEGDLVKARFRDNAWDQIEFEDED